MWTTAYLQAYYTYDKIATMNEQVSKKTVNIRVFRETRDRLKVKAARKRMSIMQHIEELSRIKNGIQ